MTAPAGHPADEADCRRVGQPSVECGPVGNQNSRRVTTRPTTVVLVVAISPPMTTSLVVKSIAPYPLSRSPAHVVLASSNIAGSPMDATAT